MFVREYTVPYNWCKFDAVIITITFSHLVLEFQCLLHKFFAVVTHFEGIAGHNWQSTHVAIDIIADDLNQCILHLYTICGEM